MVKKKLLTMDDLVQFCLENKFTTFSAKEYGRPLAVQVPTTFEVEDTSDNNHRGMLRLKFRILHDGKNRNGSFVSHKAAEKASNTIADRPIMAAIHKLDDGSWDFKSHEMEIIENDDGEPEINYIEKQVGSFSSEKPFWEHDDELDKDYLCAYGYVAEEYTKAADIIREKGWTKNSCELVIEEMAFNAKEKQLELNSFYLSASTLLGREDDGTPIGEGMLGSRADIADFSVENNSVFSQNEKVIKLLSELNEKLDGLNIDNSSRKEETEDLMKKKFEKEVTEEEIKDSPSTEVFDEDPDGEGGDDPNNVDYYEDPQNGEGGDAPTGNDNPSGDNPSSGDTPATNDDPTPSGGDDPTPSGGDDPTPSGGDDPTPSGGDDPTPSGDGDDDDSGDDSGDNELTIPLGQRDDDDTAGGSKKSYSVSVTNGDVTKQFSVSLQDKISALYNLVNDTYCEQDGVYYDVEVFDEDKYIIMSSWWGGDAYKQSYKVKKDVYSLVGDRVRVKAVWCTEDEEKALDSMRSNYSSIVDELASFKAEPEKEAVLAEECYAQIADTDAFKELSKKENHFSMSVDEVRAEADKQLLEYAKGHKIEFSANEEKKPIGTKRVGNPLKKATPGSGRYGSLFS